MWWQQWNMFGGLCTTYLDSSCTSKVCSHVTVSEDWHCCPGADSLWRLQGIHFHDKMGWHLGTTVGKQWLARWGQACAKQRRVMRGTVATTVDTAFFFLRFLFFLTKDCQFSFSHRFSNVICFTQCKIFIFSIVRDHFLNRAWPLWSLEPSASHLAKCWTSLHGTRCHGCWFWICPHFV